MAQGFLAAEGRREALVPPFPPAPARLAVTWDVAGRLVVTEELGSPLDSRIDFPGLDLRAVVQLRSLRSPRPARSRTD